MVFVQVRKLACAGDRIAPGRHSHLALRARRCDAGLKCPAPEAFDDAAVPFDGLEQSPRLVAQGIGQRLETACARSGIGDAGEVCLLHEDQAGVSCKPAGECVRQAEGGREGQHRDRVRATEAGREGRDGRAQQVHPRIAPGRHPPRGFGVEAKGLRREAAALLNARPKQAQGSELGDRQEFVRIGDEKEREGVAGVIERLASGFEGPQIGDAG
jgi:hypothetical protein